MGSLKARRAAWLICVCALAACDFSRQGLPLEFAEETIGVFSMLRAGDDSAAVTVVRFPSRPEPFLASWSPVGGATVLLISDTDTTQLAESETGASGCFAFGESRPPLAPDSLTHAGCYHAAVPFGIRPGARYRLRVLDPHGGVITGEAVVPRPAQLLEPTAAARLLVHEGGSLIVDSMRVRWQAAADIERLELALIPDAAGCKVELPNRMPWADALAFSRERGDSAVVYIQGIFCRNASGPVSCALKGSGATVWNNHGRQLAFRERSVFLQALPR
jgi:hypothetical protein